MESMASISVRTQLQQAESVSQQTKTWIDQLLRGQLENFKIENFQSADTIQKQLSELDFWHSDDSWIENESHSFGTLYCRDNFKGIQSLLAHNPFHAHLDFEQVRLADSQRC
jgi:hypothetical protein